MILVDANLLIYAYIPDFREHDAARHWLEEVLSGSVAVGLPWISLLAFLRLVCNPRMLRRPAKLEDAWTRVEAWLETPNVWMPGPGEQHQAVFRKLLPQTAGRSALVSDAHLAALAIEHGLTLCSTDADFARFRGLRWENPLEPA